MVTSISSALAFKEWCKSDYSTEHSVIDDNDLSGCILDNGRHDVSDPKYGLGVLDTMPVEILDAVFSQLDIKTLTTFRCVSRRAMQALDHQLEYSTIVAQCPDIFRALLSLETASLTTLRQLHTALHQSKCHHCGNFSGHIYLVFCTRVCLRCFSAKRIEYVPFPSDLIFISSLGLPGEVLRDVPSFKSLPGRYGHSRYGSYLIAQQRSRWYDRESIKSLVQDEPSPRAACRAHAHRQYLAIMRAPILGAEGDSNRRGFGCIACRNMFKSAEHLCDARYDDERFRSHLDYFGNVYWNEVQKSYVHDDVDGSGHIDALISLD